MKKILEFDCPEEEESFREHLHGPKYHTIIWDLVNDKLRPIYKHGLIPEGYTSEEIVRFADEIREYIFNCASEEGVSEDF